MTFALRSKDCCSHTFICRHVLECIEIHRKVRFQSLPFIPRTCFVQINMIYDVHYQIKQLFLGLKIRSCYEFRISAFRQPWIASYVWLLSTICPKAMIKFPKVRCGKSQYGLDGRIIEVKFQAYICIILFATPRRDRPRRPPRFAS